MPESDIFALTMTHTAPNWNTWKQLEISWEVSDLIDRFFGSYLYRLKPWNKRLNAIASFSIKDIFSYIVIPCLRFFALGYLVKLLKLGY